MNKSAPAADLQPRLVEAMQLHVQGKLDAALATYQALLKDYPGQPDLLHAIGTIYLQAQQGEKAADYFRQAAAANPGQPRHLLPLARIYKELGKPERAIETAVALLDADRNHEEGQVMLHDLCLPDARAQGVKGSLIERLIQEHPAVLGLYSVAIRLCRTLEEHVYRITYFEALYKIGARSEPFCVEYGAMLRNNGQHERCLKLCNEWLKEYPDSLDLLRLRGSMCVSLGKHAQGLADWSRVSKEVPNDHQARAAVGLIKLLTTDLKEGFEEFSATRDRMIALGDMKVAIPEWKGESLKGRKILLWSTEGLGDTIMYAGFLPWVIEQGAEVTLALFPRLEALFARSFPFVRLVPFEQHTLTRCAGEVDCQIAFALLPQYALPHYVPARHPPYLLPDKDHVQKLRQKYQGLFPDKQWVGISWFTKNKDSFAHRNITLEQWEPIFTLSNIQVISLQYMANQAEIDAINRAFPGAIFVDPDIDPVSDIDGLAAQIAALDEVVSVQNTTIHMGGSIGVKTTILLSAASEWRWGLKRTDNHWYKSVTVERQEKLMDWAPVMQRMRERLAHD